jgi:hypothetical protein
MSHKSHTLNNKARGKSNDSPLPPATLLKQVDAKIFVDKSRPFIIKFRRQIKKEAVPAHLHQNGKRLKLKVNKNSFLFKI